MKIVVCIKQTFDSEEQIVINDGKVIDNGVEYIINPYDEYALEEAISLRDKYGGEVTVITIGPARSESAIRTALAMGVDHGVIVDNSTIPQDQYTVSKVLAELIKERGFDLIFAGNSSIDSGSGQVPIRLAEELDIPHISNAIQLSIEGEQITVHRDVEGDIEVIQSSIPILITAQQGLNEPRYPSLPGIMKAKKKGIECLNASDLLLSEPLVSKTIIVDEYTPQKKAAGRLLEGEISSQVQQLVTLLRNEARVF